MNFSKNLVSQNQLNCAKKVEKISSTRLPIIITKKKQQQQRNNNKSLKVSTPDHPHLIKYFQH